MMIRKIKSILLIDDDELFNFIHLTLLKNFKNVEKIEIAVNGKDALKFFQEKYFEIPEIVFIDIDMPNMNGFEFLQEIHKNHKYVFETTKFYMLTSSDNLSDINKAKEFNLSGYLIKPLTKEHLKEIL